MNESYNAVFEREIKLSNLSDKGIRWKFTYLKPFVCVYYDYDKKEILVDNSMKTPGIREFKRLIRFSLYHAKGGRSRIIAHLAQYFPVVFLYHTHQ